MRTNKKGFTLIELLAVIVILAIIALIATPIVLNIITKARRSASQDGLYGVMAAARTAYMSSLLDETPISLPMTVNCNATDCSYVVKVTDSDGNESEVRTKIDFSGTAPTEGTFVVNNEGKINDATGIKVNGFTCRIDNEKVTCE